MFRQREIKRQPRSVRLPGQWFEVLDVRLLGEDNLRSMHEN